MVKLKKPFYLLITIFVIVVAVIVGMIAYLLSSGVMVKYDVGQKRYLIDASENKYLESLALKYFRDLVSTNESTSTIEKTKENKSFGELVGIKNQENQNKQNTAVFYPYFPENTETFLDEAHTFQMKAFQPIFKEFIELAPNRSFLVVNYSDSPDGVLKEAKILLRGQIPYAGTEETGTETTIASIKLKDLLKVGDQFGIYYLSKIPSDFSIEMPYCQPQGQGSQKPECLLAPSKQGSDKYGDNIFYPFSVYRVLKL